MLFDALSFNLLDTNTVKSTLDSTEGLGAKLKYVPNPSTTFEHEDAGRLSEQLREVSRIIDLDINELHTERAAFYTTLGGFDTHNTGDLDELFAK